MLTDKQQREFRSSGFLMSGPQGSVAGQLPGSADIHRLLATDGPAPDPAVERHLDDPLTYRLCTMPAIVERVAALLGPDVLLWHSRYFSKPAGGPPVPWHQDAPFWRLESQECISVWLALEDAHAGNGCVYAVPGSHKTPLPHVPSHDTGRFGMRADVTGYDLSGAIPLEMPRGEYYLFDRWLLHKSGIGAFGESRLALAMQFIAPDVRLGLERLTARVPNYGVLVVRGCDRLRLNPVAAAPVQPH